MGIGGWIKAWFGSASRQQFSVQTQWQPSQLMAYRAEQAGLLRITRDDALSVPAVLRGRNMICSISTLPLEAVNADNVVQDHPLLRQVDRNVPNVVTMAQTVEDLLFESVAWWRITGFGWDGYPVSAVRMDPAQVHMDPPDDYDIGRLPSGLTTSGVIWMGGQPVPWAEVIRFDSPNPALLKVAARSIGRAMALDAAAEMYANEPRPMDYFTPSDASADPVDDDTVEGILNTWRASRKKRSTAYVPAALTYNEVQQPTPADLQLVQLQQRVTLDLANMLGIDPEDLGVSTTSRTYQNATDRRKDRVNDVLASYMKAITDRLGMPDVTKRGVLVRFNLDDYLKADPKTRAEVQQAYVGMGVISPAYVAKVEGLPPEATPPEPPAPAVIPATVAEPAMQQIEAA